MRHARIHIEDRGARLDGDVAPKAGIAGAIDFAQSAGAQRARISLGLTALLSTPFIARPDDFS